jgi:polysaccharide biosynthesis protein PelF
VSHQIADICLILEGTYPYITGGVSGWAHELIKSSKDKTFHLVSIVPLHAKLTRKYEIPKNVLSIKTIHLQKIPQGKVTLKEKEQKKFFEKLEHALMNLQRKSELSDVKNIADLMQSIGENKGEDFLLNSHASWTMLLRVYNTLLGQYSFLNFFWVFRGALASIYSLFLDPIPQAKIYHTLCTGFAGLYLARAKVETNKPCCLTEHGIYTNERRIELIASNYLFEENFQDLSIGKKIYEGDIKDFLINLFTTYAKLTYKASSEIITLFEGNRLFQLEEGASTEKIKIIPNGMDIARYEKVKKEANCPQTVALIGRIVPIKDIKTFIRAVGILKKRLREVQALIIGPQDEDPSYFLECLSIVEKEGLKETITFTGKVDIESYLSKIDVIALTSISEAQPLVILEAGVCGIPFVSTDTGSCRELAFGVNEENPSFGQGGIIVRHLDAEGFADSIYALLTDKKMYAKLSDAIKKRVLTYYRKEQQEKSYEELYKNLLKISEEASIWQG